MMANYIQILLICFTLVVLSYQNEEDNSQTKREDAQPKDLSEMEKEKKHQQLLAAIENRAKYGRIREKSGCVNIDCMKKYVQNIKERRFKMVKVGDATVLAGRGMRKSKDDEDLDVDFDSIDKDREKRHVQHSGKRHKRLSHALNTDGDCATASCKVPEGYCVKLEPGEYISLPIPNHPLLRCCPLYKCYFHGHLGRLPSISQEPSNEQNQLNPKGQPNHGETNPKGQPNNGEIQSKGQPNHGEMNPKGQLNLGEMNPKGQPNHGEMNPKGQPNHGEIQSKGQPNHGEIQSKVQPNHGEMNPKVQPNHGEMNPKGQPNHGEMNTKGQPNHEEMNPKMQPNHGETQSKGQPNHGEMNPKGQPYQGEMQSKVQPNQGEMQSKGQSYHEKMQAKGKPNNGEMQSNGQPNQGIMQSTGQPHQGRKTSKGQPNQGEMQSNGQSNQGEMQSNGQPNQGEMQSNGQPNQEEMQSNGQPNQGGMQSNGQPNQGEMQSNGQHPNQETKLLTQSNPPLSKDTGKDFFQDAFNQAFKNDFNNLDKNIENNIPKSNDLKLQDSPTSSNVVEPNQKVQSENKKVNREDNKANFPPTDVITKGETKGENMPNGVSITSHVSDNGTKIVEGVGTGKSDVTVNASDDDDFDDNEMEDMLREMEEIKNAGLEEIALSKMFSIKPLNLGGVLTNVLGTNSLQDPIQHKSPQSGNGLLGGLTNALGIPGHQIHNTAEPNKGGGLLGGLSNVLIGGRRSENTLENTTEKTHKTKAPSSSAQLPDPIPRKQGGGLFGLLG